MAHAHPLRKTYLVNPQLQISLTVRMLGVAAMAFAITVLNLTAFCYLSSACSGLPSTSAVRGAYATLAEGYGLLYLLLMVIFSFGALVIVCLLIAHKVAGPEYKIQKFAFDDEATAEGAMTLRRGDYLGDLSVTMTEAAELRRARQQELRKQFNELRVELDAIDAGRKLHVLANEVSLKINQL